MSVPGEMIFGKDISDHEDQATKGRSNAQLWSPLPQEAKDERLQGTKRMRTRTLSDGAVQAVEENARTTATTVIPCFC